MNDAWGLSAYRCGVLRCLCAVLFLASPNLYGVGIEVPSLAAQVALGELPPLAQRLPQVPRVIRLEGDLEPGRHGGELRLLMGRDKDVRMINVYGYARLIGYDQRFELQADIASSIQVREEREFTIVLRRGHRWSDGEPFTSEDFRYWWEDILQDKELSPFGPPSVMRVDGQLPRFEVIDALTVRYTWEKPNPFFRAALAGTHALYIYAPAHYLKQFHKRYAGDARKLQRLATENGQRDWTGLHVNEFRPYKFTNPDLPTLDPWLVTTRPPSMRFEFKRNPYFHRVDVNGRQLPYIDTVIVNIADGKLIPAKAGAGESDLQARSLSFADFTFLKSSEKRTLNDVRLWQTTKGAHLALFPNLNAQDPVWRKLLRDVRFRRALSLAVDRHEINQVIYYGLAVEGNNSVNSNCPLFEPHYQRSWAGYDPQRANALLDELGLTERDSRGIRLLSNGKPVEVIVETAGEDTEQTDVLELIESTWRSVGVKLYTKPLQREVFRNRIFAGKTLMSIWGGLENGLPTADMSPAALAPTSQQQLQWPMWGQHFEMNGSIGEAPDIAEAQQLLALNEQWLRAASRTERAEVWKKMLNIHAEQTFTIGLISGVPQPVVVNRRLRNVPSKGVYNWEPGAHFGIYNPDTFWHAPQ
jgi:peptide/nickel transport system substrate-binding protein